MLLGCAFSLHRSAHECRGLEGLLGCMPYRTRRLAGMPNNIAGMHVSACKAARLHPTAMSLSAKELADASAGGAGAGHSCH